MPIYRMAAFPLREDGKSEDALVEVCARDLTGCFAAMAWELRSALSRQGEGKPWPPGGYELTLSREDCESAAATGHPPRAGAGGRGERAPTRGGAPDLARVTDYMRRLDAVHPERAIELRAERRHDARSACRAERSGDRAGFRPGRRRGGEPGAAAAGGRRAGRR